MSTEPPWTSTSAREYSLALLPETASCARSVNCSEPAISPIENTAASSVAASRSQPSANERRAMSHMALSPPSGASRRAPGRWWGAQLVDDHAVGEEQHPVGVRGGAGSCVTMITVWP